MAIPSAGRQKATQTQQGDARQRMLATLFLTSVCVAWLGVTTFAPTRAAPHPAPHLHIGAGETSLYTVAPGGAITVAVAIESVTNLGAATVLLTYDPALVQVLACQPSELAGVDVSACNPTFANGAVRYAVAASAGLDGAFPLFTVTFQAIGAAGATAQLALAAPHFADTLGNDLPVTTSGGAIAIAGAPLPVDATVRLTDRHGMITPGQNLVVAIAVDVTATHSLAVATFLLHYNPQLVRPVQCVRAAASALLGSCNPAFNLEQGLVKFNALSGEGASGLLPLFDLTFEAVAAAPPGAVSPLTVTALNLVDPAGTALRWQAEDGWITVTAGPANAAQIRVGAPETDGVFALSQGEILTAPVWISDVVNLGAATAALVFDPALVQPLGCTIDFARVDGGGCRVERDRVEANIIAGRGISGSLPFFAVAFTPLADATAGLHSPLTIGVLNFADAQAEPLPWRVRAGQLDIVAGEAPALALVSVGAGASPAAIAQDGELTVTVAISAVTNLGAATLAVTFDQAVVNVVACRVVGAFDAAHCAVREGAVAISLLRMHGFTGATPVAELLLRAAAGAGVGDQTPLALAVSNFSDAAGAPLRFQLANSTVIVGAPVGVSAEVSLHLDSPAYHGGPGERIWVSLQASLDSASLPSGLDVASMLLRYNPAVLRPVACVVNNAAFQIGACNPGYTTDSLRFSLLGGNGVTGTVTLVEIQFEAIGQPGDLSSLAPIVEQLVAVGGMAPTQRTESAAFLISSETDGVPDHVEAGAPNLGDGNGDGIQDMHQVHVASLPNLLDGRYLTLVAPPPACLKKVQFVANPAPADTPYGWAFPLGFSSFRLGCIAAGSAVTVTLLLHDAGALQLDQFFVYSRAGTPLQSAWRPFLLADGIGALFAGERVTLYLSDGQRGDDDATSNGEIVFLGAPARPGAAVSVAPLVLSVVEGGASADYHVTLLARPAAPVTITATTSGQTHVTPTLLNFHLENWSVVQTVIVSAAEDAADEGHHGDEIQHAVASGDSLYATLVMPSVTVLITDSYGAPPPTPTSTPTPTPTPTSTPTPTPTPGEPAQPPKLFLAPVLCPDFCFTGERYLPLILWSPASERTVAETP